MNRHIISKCHIAGLLAKGHEIVRMVNNPQLENCLNKILNPMRFIRIDNDALLAIPLSTAASKVPA